MIWLLTCEHYSNGLPLKYAEKFVDAVDVLESHRGYDIQVAPLFLRLEPLFDEGMHYRYSRLLIEPNRSIGDKFLFSPFTSTLPIEERTELINKYYQPYRRKVESFIGEYIDQQVFHISLHSFTPTSGNQVRESSMEIGFDRDSKGSLELAQLIRQSIHEADEDLSIRYNYPYRGEQNDFMQYLRRCYPENYYGFSLEIRNDKCLNVRSPLYAGLANLRGIIG